MKAKNASHARVMMQVAVFACTTPNTLQPSLINLHISTNGGQSWIQADGLLSVYSPNSSAALAPYNGLAPWPDSMLSPMAELSAERAKLPCVLSTEYTTSSSALSMACRLDTVRPRHQ